MNEESIEPIRRSFVHVASVCEGRESVVACFRDGSWNNRHDATENKRTVKRKAADFFNGFRSNKSGKDDKSQQL